MNPKHSTFYLRFLFRWDQGTFCGKKKKERQLSEENQKWFRNSSIEDAFLIPPNVLFPAITGVLLLWRGSTLKNTNKQQPLECIFEMLASSLFSLPTR